MPHKPASSLAILIVHVGVRMADVSAALVKELREKTGFGIMECRRALVDSNGDMALAAERLAVTGQVKAAKRADRVAAEGLVAIAVSGRTRRPRRAEHRNRFRGPDGGVPQRGPRLRDPRPDGRR